MLNQELIINLSIGFKMRNFPKPEIEEYVPQNINRGHVHNVLWFITINSNKELIGERAQHFKSVIDDLFYDKLYFLFRTIDQNEGTDENLINPDDINRLRILRHYEIGSKIGRFHVHILVRMSHTVPSGVTFRADELKESLRQKLGYNIYLKPRVHADSITNLEEYISKTQGKITQEDKNNIISSLMDSLRK